MVQGRTQRLIIPFEVDLDATVSDKFTWVLKHPMQIHKVTFIYTEATDSAIPTPGAVSFDHKPAGGSRVEKGSYTAEVSQAVGTEKDVFGSNPNADPFAAGAGDTLYFEHKTQQTSTEAGKGVFVLYYEPINDGVIG